VSDLVRHPLTRTRSLPPALDRCARRVVRVWFLDGGHGWSPRLYEGFFTRTPWGRKLRESEAQAIVRALRAYGTAGRHVLEIGAGTGAYTDLLARTGAQVEVREPSPAMRSYLRTRARRGWWESVRIEDGRLPGPLGVSSTFAIVLAVGVLNYVPDLGWALRSMAHALDPGGVVIINVPTAERPAGSRYRTLELLGRRRVWCRTWAEIESAARRAGLRVDVGPHQAGVTDLYVLRPRLPSPRVADALVNDPGGRT
jgi:SAM-dependent methyltransferase